MSQEKLSVVEIARNAHRDLNLLPYPALPEREIVRRVLHLANDCTDEEKEEGLLVSMLSHGMPSPTAATLARIHGSDYLRKAWSSISAERDRFREKLEMVYSDRAAARKELRSEVVKGLGEIVPIPKLSLTDEWKVLPEVRYFALSVGAACAFALALLLDESAGLGTALKKCKLSPCHNIFLSLPSAAGGRPPLYCNRDHQAEYAAQSGADRTQRWRKRQAKKRGNKL